MEKVYRNFIQCIRERDYESIGWILNNTDPKALYNLIFKMNLQHITDGNGNHIAISLGKRGMATLSWSIDSGYVTISVKFSEDEKIDYKTMLDSLYPKFPLITLSILYKENAFSIDICSPLEDCISTKFEKEYKTSEEVHDGIPKSVIDGIIEEMSEDEIVEYDGGEHK